MNIGIIGAGEIGGTLTRQYTKAGHHVKIANASGPERLKSIAQETGAKPVTVADVVSDVDVIVISIPFFAVKNLPKDLFKHVKQNVPIIDTCNYYPIVSGTIQEVEDGMHESIWIANQIGRTVVKAYNSIFYRSLLHSGLPSGHASRLALPIAGDNKQAKQIVASLVNDSGFDCYDQGTLAASWRQEPGSPVYCTDLTVEQLKRSIPKAEKELLAARREQGVKHIFELGPERWTDLVQLNRQIYESAFAP